MNATRGSRLRHEAISVLEALDCVVAGLEGADAGASTPVHYLIAGQGGHSVALAITGLGTDSLPFETVEKLHRMAIEIGGRPIVAGRTSDPQALRFADLGDLAREPDDDNVYVAAESDGFDRATFATVRYATTTAGVVIEDGRTEFLKGVMA